MKCGGGLAKKTRVAHGISKVRYRCARSRENVNFLVNCSSCTVVVETLLFSV